MHTQTRIEAAPVNDAASTIFQLVTIAMVGLFSLAQTVQFLAGAMA